MKQQDIIRTVEYVKYFSQIAIHAGRSVSADERDIASSDNEREIIDGFIKKFFKNVQPGAVIEEPCIYTV